MTTDIVKQHDVTQIDKLVATYSKLDPAATAAKWKELDGAVEKSIVAIDQKFDTLGANLIKVRAFLSQMENPGRKAEDFRSVPSRQDCWLSAWSARRPVGFIRQAEGEEAEAAVRSSHRLGRNKGYVQRLDGKCFQARCCHCFGRSCTGCEQRGRGRKRWV